MSQAYQHAKLDVSKVAFVEHDGSIEYRDGTLSQVVWVGRFGRSVSVGDLVQCYYCLRDEHYIGDFIVQERCGRDSRIVVVEAHGVPDSIPDEDMSDPVSITELENAI